MSDTQVTATSKVKITRDGEVAILTMADPATMNAAGVEWRPSHRAIKSASETPLAPSC